MHISNWDLGDMKFGLFVVRLPALKMREMRLVLVSSAEYTTVKQNPAPNLRANTNILYSCVVFGVISRICM